MDRQTDRSRVIPMDRQTDRSRVIPRDRQIDLGSFLWTHRYI